MMTYIGVFRYFSPFVSLRSEQKETGTKLVRSSPQLDQTSSVTGIQSFKMFIYELELSR